MKDFPTQQEQLVEYIKKNLAKGYTSDALKFSLINQGQSRLSVKKAFEAAEKQIEQEKPKITHTLYTQKNMDLIVLEHGKPQKKAKPTQQIPEPKKSFFQKLFRR